MIINYDIVEESFENHEEARRYVQEVSNIEKMNNDDYFIMNEATSDEYPYLLEPETVEEAFGENIKIPGKLYHGSTELYDELRPTGIDFGNSLQEPGWSLFTWTGYDAAIGWSIFCVIRRLGIENHGCRNSQTTFLTKSGYDELKRNIDHIPIKEKTFYIYTIKPELDYKFGLGHSSNTPNCITIRKDHIKPMKIDKLILDMNLVDMHCIVVDDDYEPTMKEYGRNNRLLSFLMNHDFMYQHKIRKQIKRDVEDGKLGVGDDIVAYLKNNDIELKNISVFDRLHESLELYLTKPKYIGKEITLYHASPERLEKIDPISQNVGTRLSNPRTSSFWIDEPKLPIVFAIRRLIMDLHNANKCQDVCYMVAKETFQIKVSAEDKNNFIREMKSKKIYLHEKTVPSSMVGRGHGIGIGEFTVDVPVVPDYIEEYAYDDFKSFIDFTTEEDIANTYKMVAASGNYGKFMMRNSNWVERLIYLDTKAYSEKSRLQKSYTISENHVLNTLLEMNRELNMYEYGIPKNGIIQDIPSEEYYYENWRYLSPKEFSKVKGGTCWDYVAYQTEYLASKGITARNFYIIDDNGATHTISIVISNGKFYYPESSFKRIRGLYVHKNLKSILRFVVKEMGIKNYCIYEFKKNTNYGCSCAEYMQWMEDKGKLISKGNTMQIPNILTDKPINIQTIEPMPKDRRLKESLELVEEEAHYSSTDKYPVFIVLMHTGTSIANAIKAFTHDEFSHACISFNSRLDPLYSFGRKKLDAADSGFVINKPKAEFFTKFHSYYSVYVMYVNKKAIDLMKQRLEYFIENEDNLKFDNLSMVGCGLGIASEKSKKYFCSRFCMEIIGQGVELEKVPSLYKPQDMSELDNISLVNKGADFYNYDYKETERNLKKIKKGSKNHE